MAQLLMANIQEAIPPAAVPLIARTLLEAPERSVEKGALISRARSLGNGEPLDYETALRTLVMRGLISAVRDGYQPAPGGGRMLAYYANSAYR